jgi:hypothetical protein
MNIGLVNGIQYTVGLWLDSQLSKVANHSRD